MEDILKSLNESIKKATEGTKLYEAVEQIVVDAVDKYIAEHGNTFEIYVDYNDELDDRTWKKIFDSQDPLEAFNELLMDSDWYEWQEYDEIFKQLDLPEEYKEEHDMQIKEYLQERISWSIPFDHYDATLSFDVFLQNPNDHAETDTIIWNEQDGEEVITALDGTIEKLIELQGYNVLDFEEYYQAKMNKKEVQENKFFDNLIEEIENCTYNYGNEVVFLVQGTFSEVAKAIKEGKQITIPADAMCGLHNAGNGSGSILDIKLEKDLTLTIGKDCEVFYKDGYSYNVDETHGLVASAWNTDLIIG